MAAIERRRSSKAEKRKKKFEKHKRTENDTEENVAPSIERLSSFGRIRRESLPNAETEMNKHDIQLVEQVGRGSFGVVWRALHKPTSTQVAVKLFLSEDVETEINLLAKIQRHPHVLTFLGVILEQDDPYKEPREFCSLNKFPGPLHHVNSSKTIIYASSYSTNRGGPRHAFHVPRFLIRTISNSLYRRRPRGLFSIFDSAVSGAGSTGCCWGSSFAPRGYHSPRPCLPQSPPR